MFGLLQFASTICAILTSIMLPFMLYTCLPKLTCSFVVISQEKRYGDLTTLTLPKTKTPALHVMLEWLLNMLAT